MGKTYGSIDALKDNANIDSQWIKKVKDRKNDRK